MDQTKVVKLYTASLVEVEGIQGYLEENGISTSVRDEFNEGLHAGFPNGVPNDVTLMVMEKELEKAQGLLKAYLESEVDS